MIQIYADGVLTYDSRLKEAGKDYTLLGLKVTTGLNKGGTAEILMPPGHPAYSFYTSYRTIVEIVRDDVLLFRGRALYPADDFYNRRTVTCEGELCFFQDGVSRPYLYQAAPAEIFTAVVETYNAQVEAFKRFKVGEITVTDANDYVRLESETAEQCLDTLNKLLERCGGYIVFTTDPDDGARVVNWYADLDRHSGQTVEFGSNLLNFARTGANTDLLTAVLPYGAKDDDTGERLTIKSVNGGKDYIQDDAAVALRGLIMKPVTWDDVTEAGNLLSKARKYLAENRQIVTSLELTAVDLSRLDKSIDSYQVGDIVRVKSKPHAVDDDFQLTERTEDLLDPSQGSITLGKDIRTLTSADVAGDNQTRSDLQKTTQSIKKDYQLNTAKAVEETERKMSSMIEQQADSIKLEVTDGTPGNKATIKLTVGEGEDAKVYSGQIDMTGLVTFTNLQTKGQTVINGSNITTGEILADLIKAGVIRSKDGSSVVIDLDAGEVDITGTFTTKTADDGSGNRCRTRIVSDGIIMQKTDSYGESSLSNLTSTAMILNGDSGQVSASANSITADATISVFGSYDGSFGEVLSRADGQKALADIILRNPSLSTKLVIRSQNERNYITGLTAPVDSSDAVNKAYVDKRAENVFYQTDANGNISLSGISAYPTKSGVYRVISVVAGLPDDVNGYGSLVIFNGGSYMLHLYQDANGLLYYARTADGVTVPTSWKVCGGKRCIWTNPSPSADFARQNVNRDLSEYNFVNIKFAFHKTLTDSLYCWWERCPIGEMGAATFTSIGGTSYPVTVRRTFYATQNGIQFSTGAYHQGTTFNESDPSRAIPLEIYVE